MTKTLILEQITVREFNELRAQFNIPTEEDNAIVEPRMYGRILGNDSIEVKRTSPEDYFRIVYTNLQDILNYLKEQGRILICVHPPGQWPMNRSVHRTTNETEAYFRELSGMYWIERLVIRAKNKDASKRHKRDMNDAFSFDNNKGLWILRTVDIPWRNFGDYRFVGKSGSVLIHYRERDRIKAIFAGYK